MLQIGCPQSPHLLPRPFLAGHVLAVAAPTSAPPSVWIWGGFLDSEPLFPYQQK